MTSLLFGILLCSLYWSCIFVVFFFRRYIFSCGSLFFSLASVFTSPGFAFNSKGLLSVVLGLPLLLCSASLSCHGSTFLGFSLVLSVSS